MFHKGVLNSTTFIGLFWTKMIRIHQKHVLKHLFELNVAWVS